MIGLFFMFILSLILLEDMLHPTDEYFELIAKLLLRNLEEVSSNL